MLTRDGQLLARNRTFEPLFREMTWPKANPRIELRNHRAIFTSDIFCWGICLDLDGEKPLADNFFDLWPGIPYEIPWEDRENPRIIHLGNLG